MTIGHGVSGILVVTKECARHVHRIDADTADPTCVGGIQLIQAIPGTCESEPGTVGPAPVGPHWNRAFERTKATAEV